MRSANRVSGTDRVVTTTLVEYTTLGRSFFSPQYCFHWLLVKLLYNQNVLDKLDGNNADQFRSHSYCHKIACPLSRTSFCLLKSTFIRLDYIFSCLQLSSFGEPVPTEAPAFHFG
ncbi:hypothetical protein QTP86_022246 [Hemibagrus guttatus]|nr:hypothetical protein QTP86_022246 [Hemibagrus guttatus]